MENDAPRVIWIDGPKLRKRWGNMSNSTFYARLQRQAIPAPVYPFGESKPYWLIADIEAFEARVRAEAVAA
jgi:hypothetical protein